MSSPVDNLLAGVRGILGTAVLSIDGTTLQLSKFPEQPPLGMIYDSTDYPIITLEPSGVSRGSFQRGKSCSTIISLGLGFVLHLDNLDAHPTVRSPFEYARKGAEAVDAALAAEIRSLSNVLSAEWQEAGFDSGDEGQKLYAWRTTWAVEYDGDQL